MDSFHFALSTIMQNNVNLLRRSGFCFGIPVARPVLGCPGTMGLSFAAGESSVVFLFSTNFIVGSATIFSCDNYA
jgi:hypothetical protein